MKKTTKRLKMNRETIKALNAKQLGMIAGGATDACVGTGSGSCDTRCQTW